MTLPDGYRFPDLSRYRTVCDWGDYSRAYPISACKASEGATYRDPSFAKWREGMRRYGLFPIAYHFLRREYQIEDQVNNYLNAVVDGHPFGVMLDIETSGVRTDPSIAQADAWFTLVSLRTGIPRSRMMCYMPRWWYNTHGSDQHVLQDTILWNSHFSSSPNLSSFAGDKIDVIQYSSTDTIVGVCAPGIGDMNIAIKMTVEQFLAKIKGSPAPLPVRNSKEKNQVYMITSTNPERGIWKLYGDTFQHISSIHTAMNMLNVGIPTIEYDDSDFEETVRRTGVPYTQLESVAVTVDQVLQAIKDLNALTSEELEAIKALPK